VVVCRFSLSIATQTADNWGNGLNNTNEKRELREQDREYIIHVLDEAYQSREPLASQLHIFEPFEITLAERKSMILASDYSLDTDLVSALVLFG